MKIKLILLLALLAVMLTAIACAPAESPAPATTALAVSAATGDFDKQNNLSRELQVASGDTFTVTLDSNQTTGFRWSETAAISDQTVLQQMEHKYVLAQSERLGAAGQEVWTFKALKTGNSTISMDYSRPWEGGEKGVWTYKLAVTVK